MTAIEAKPSPQVPHWLIRTIWFVHRRAYAITGGRLRPSNAGRPADGGCSD